MNPPFSSQSKLNGPLKFWVLHKSSPIHLYIYIYQVGNRAQIHPPSSNIVTCKEESEGIFADISLIHCSHWSNRKERFLIPIIPRACWLNTSMPRSWICCKASWFSQALSLGSWRIFRIWGWEAKKYFLKHGSMGRGMIQLPDNIYIYMYVYLAACTH